MKALRWFLITILLMAIVLPVQAQTDARFRDATIFRKLEGRGGIPLYWDGFIFQQYAGTTRDVIYANYTGTGNFILRLLGDGSNVFTVDKSGNIIAAGSFAPGSLLLPDTDASNTLSLVWNENDTSDRILNFLVSGADATLTIEGVNAVVNQDTTTDGTPQFTRLGIGEAADAADILELTSALTTSYNAIDLTPTGAMGASQTFRGFYINGANLDPSAASAEIYGALFDFTGVNLTNDPIIEGIKIDMPATYSGQEDHSAAEFTGNGMIVEVIDNDKGQNALHIAGGHVGVDRDLPNTANTSFAGIDVDLIVDQLAATSLVHALNVVATGSAAGEVTAVGTHPGVAPVHQHVGTFVTPSQTEYAARVPDGGSWTDGIDGNQIFVADDDEIYIGDAAMFDALEVILTTPATKDVFAEYYFYDTSPAWVEFFPNDSTNGYRQDGEVDWDSANLTNWKSDYDPAAADSSTGYYIKVKRTRVVVVGPTPTTIKILAATEYEWDENGNLDVNGIISTNEMFINATDFTPDPDGTDNPVSFDISDQSQLQGRRMFFRSTGIGDTEDVDWIGVKNVDQTPTTMTMWVRASDFANCSVSVTISDGANNADATGAVDFTPSQDNVFEEMTYTFTSTYGPDDELKVVVSYVSLDTDDTIDCGRGQINF